MNTKRPLSLEGLMLISSLLAVAVFLGLGAAMKNTSTPETIHEEVAETEAEHEDSESTASEEEHQDNESDDEATEDHSEDDTESVQQPVTNTAKPDVEATESTIETTNTAPEDTIEDEADHIHVTFQVTSPNGAKEYTFSAHANSTVEEAMVLAKKEGLTYTQKEYSGVGSYITTINGLSENKKADMYWVYYVNEARATTGISMQKLKEGDAVRWNYEKAF